MQEVHVALSSCKLGEFCQGNNSTICNSESSACRDRTGQCLCSVCMTPSGMHVVSFKCADGACLLLQAPWGLALLEAVFALLTYSLLVPCAVPIRCSAQKFHFSLNHSLEDVMLLSVLRAVAVLLSYLCSTAQSCHK